MREWFQRFDVQTLFIGPGSHWENGYNESFNGKQRDELLTMKSALRYGKKNYPRCRRVTSHRRGLLQVHPVHPLAAVLLPLRQ